MLIYVAFLIFAGPDASIAELTDFSCAAQLSRKAEVYLPDDDLKPRYNGVSKIKKRNFFDICKKKNDPETETICLPNPMIGFGVPSLQRESIN
ncbi:DNA (cytosine-5)-methyltransferase DRM2-like [Olea europaea subsp. europaea]|uniref:DNA (Cytosine-5)-methyltransferase DRM2-like n=1 Tax=Olea europaea subsp. europaea TaxID=158383 RepID=A0A8S0SZ94_OLEEU|nr:DNA (cytosine-5)-methyltransferase DRM2-like [Olea europaea subsp. europaea]